MSTELLSDHEVTPKLIGVGGGAWLARDPAMPDDDARGVLAYLEEKNHRVYVLSVRDPQGVCCYATLHEALGQIARAHKPAGTRA